MFPQSGELSFSAALRDIGSQNPRARVRAAESLGRAQAEEERDLAFSALAAAVGDPRPEVRQVACLALSELERSDAASIVALLLSDTDSQVRQSAAIALGSLGGPECFDELATALRDGPPDLRFQCLTSLAEVDADRARPLLREALADEDAEVQGAAALALGMIGAQDAKDDIVELLTHERRMTRLDAACALSELDDPRAKPALREALESADGWDALEALLRLGPCPSELEEFLASNQGNDTVRVRAAGALLAQRAESSTAERILKSYLRHRKIELRGLAISAFGQAGHKRHLPVLEKSLRSFRMRHQRDDLRQAVELIQIRSSEGKGPQA